MANCASEFSHTNSYLHGTEADLALFKQELQNLYAGTRRKRVLVVGSIGRQALYSAFHEEVAEISVRDKSGYFRDIDTVGHADLRSQPVRYEDKIHIDAEAGTLVSNFVGGCELFTFQDSKPTYLPIDPKVFRRRTRMLEDVPVYTLSVGSHMWLEKAMRAAYAPTRQKDDIAHARFSTFVERIQEAYPQEFLPDEYYDPFRQFIEYNQDEL